LLLIFLLNIFVSELERSVRNSKPFCAHHQVKLRDGEWHDAPFVEDGFVINLGDLMSRWTNDKWLSTPHRVIEPQQNNQTATNSTESSSSSAGAKGTPRRQSLAYFANLNMDAHVEAIPTCVSADRPAKYPPTMVRALMHIFIAFFGAISNFLPCFLVTNYFLFLVPMFYFPQNTNQTPIRLETTLWRNIQRQRGAFSMTPG
jgi:hypothetical protein